LLEWAELQFEVIIVPTDETYPPGLSIEQIPVHIAAAKAQAVKLEHHLPDDVIIIAADTVVIVDDRIIGKPQSPEDAMQILALLSGRVHQVITGVVIMGRKNISFHDTTHVEFHQLNTDDILFYIDRYKPFDKAGAYGIQEWIGVTGISKISGDFYNVMGLPVSRILKALKTGDF
jgi:septum formation protein